MWGGKDVAVDESGEGIVGDVVSWWERVLFWVCDSHDGDGRETRVGGNVLLRMLNAIQDVVH